jgi:endonuclease/exonuclease/phosphatase family metal-dependent hydrolase
MIKIGLKSFSNGKTEGGKKPNTLVCATLVKEPFVISNCNIGSRSLSVTINGKLVVTNVHLESGENTTDIHVKHLTKLLDSDIICGDFNDFPEEPAIKYLCTKGFNTVYIKGYPRATFTHLNKVFVLDYIFHKPTLQLKHIQWDEIKQGVSSIHPSDHVPVTADFWYLKNMCLV